jgi:hypothetical protein
LVAALEVSVTLPPWQKVVLPPGVMVGVVGTKFTVTGVGIEEAEHPAPLVTVTE